MSGGDACAIVEPSTNSTIECTIDCGCTTTSMSSYGTPNSRCASMTSSPLLTSVAEFVVTTRPMSQVGCASASAGVTAPSDSRVRPRNGTTGCRQHEPAHLGVLARAQRLRDRGVLGVDRDDLARSRQRGDQVAADDERLLVRERERAARLERRECGSEPDRAGDAVEDDVGLDIPHQLLGLVGAERGVLDAELGGLRVQRRAVRAGRQADDLEPAGVRADDVERLRADRSGGAEDQHASHPASLPRCPPRTGLRAGRHAPAAAATARGGGGGCVRGCRRRRRASRPASSCPISPSP